MPLCKFNRFHYDWENIPNVRIAISLLRTRKRCDGAMRARGWEAAGSQATNNTEGLVICASVYGCTCVLFEFCYHPVFRQLVFISVKGQTILISCKQRASCKPTFFIIYIFLSILSIKPFWFPWRTLPWHCLVTQSLRVTPWEWRTYRKFFNKTRFLNTAARKQPVVLFMCDGLC